MTVTAQAPRNTAELAQIVRDAHAARTPLRLVGRQRRPLLGHVRRHDARGGRVPVGHARVDEPVRGVHEAKRSHGRARVWN
jgi:hypothetical protein